MFSLFLIDDEPWILKGLKSIIDWESYGFRIAGLFCDAGEALESVIQSRPDVIFTDIRMPGMTGLQLMEHLKAAGLDTVVVIVSAFAEFDYAKEALEKGAFSYVLKPLQSSVMADIAERLYQQISETKAQRERQLVFDNTILALMHDSDRSVYFESLEQIPLLKDAYRVTAFCTDGVPEEKQRCFLREMRLRYGVYSIMADRFLAVVPAEGAEIYGLVEGIGFGHSSEGNSPEELPAHIREAMIALYSQLFYGCRSAEYRAPAGEGRRVAREICGVIGTELSTWQFLLDRYEEQVKKTTVMLDELMIFYNTLISGLYNTRPSGATRGDIREFTDCFDLFAVFGDVDCMFDDLRIIIRDFSGPEAPYPNLPDTMADVLKYVDEHYTGAITLEQLSEQFHISLSHLCRQFKKATGMTYTQYLSSKRIEKACELLAYTRKPIADVGVRAGYKDYFYFSKAFKKTMGVSPMQYRKEKCSSAQTEE